MPRISAFYGIAIYMYYRDHAPPHFHAIYGEYEATVAIETAEVLEGRLPRRTGHSSPSGPSPIETSWCIRGNWRVPASPCRRSRGWSESGRWV